MKNFGVRFSMKMMTFPLFGYQQRKDEANHYFRTITLDKSTFFQPQL